MVRLRYGDRTILLPGDAEKQAEYSMLNENDGAILHADVLKIANHGSKNSSMPEFLAAVSPQVAIISAGDQNPYGHPNPDLLQRLQANGIRILRTDQEGATSPDRWSQSENRMFCGLPTGINYGRECARTR